jgi:glycosyltransferase involved in cell wall biosynthesis
MNNKICVYAIAKNEEQNVERWVASMRPADHIIVLDTGSTDNTVELLLSLGVEVYQVTYEDFRFDIARNDSLNLVPDEYNIRVCTDLDEY